MFNKEVARERDLLLAACLAFTDWRAKVDVIQLSIYKADATQAAVESRVVMEAALSAITPILEKYRGGAK